MLIPTGHENLEGRRWPWITIAIIVVNFIVFGITYSGLEADAERAGEIKLKTLLIVGYHQQVELSPEQRLMVDSFKKSNPKMWERIEDPERRPTTEFGSWDIEMREWSISQANEELETLDTQLKEIRESSIVEKYAYYPTQRSFLTYITSSFLHGGWFHIIFNMWFLWLAGSVTEDAWGRPIYAIFYTLGCFVSLWAHTMAHPDSILGVIGASGAVAALMGAFLVRHFKTKISFVLIFFWGFIPRFYKFKSPAWVMLPLWLLSQLFWGSMLGEGGGVAYWSHIGGFVFGSVVALGMKFSGLEKKIDSQIESQVGWSTDPRIVEAGDNLARDPNGAVEKLTAVIAEQPENADALALLSKAYWQLNRQEENREVLGRLAKLHIKKRELDHAVEVLDDFRNSGGENFPATEWLAICRHLESIPNYERAASEYESYAKAYPTERMSVYALVAAARIQLRNLSNKTEAARLYHAADASPVPHLDWEDAIKKGLRDSANGSPTPAMA